MHKVSPSAPAYTPPPAPATFGSVFPPTRRDRDHASGPALALRAPGHLQFRAPERDGPQVRLPVRRRRNHRDRRAGGEGARRPGHHAVARPPRRERHRRSRGGRRAGPLSRDARPHGGERGPGQRLGQAHPDGTRHRRGAVPCEHGAHPRQGEGARRVRPAGHGRLRLHPAHARLLLPAALRGVRRALRRGHPVHAPALGARRGGPDRDAGAGAALQGRLPRAARRWRFPRRPTWTATT